VRSFSAKRNSNAETDRRMPIHPFSRVTQSIAKRTTSEPFLAWAIIGNPE